MGRGCKTASAASVGSGECGKCGKCGKYGTRWTLLQRCPSRQGDVYVLSPDMPDGLHQHSSLRSFTEIAQEMSRRAAARASVGAAVWWDGHKVQLRLTCHIREQLYPTTSPIWQVDDLPNMAGGRPQVDRLPNMAGG